MEIIHKGWGFEKIIVNNDKYCGKILHFFKGGKCSFHYHEQKDETFYVHTGKLLVKYGYSDDINLASEITLSAGDSFYVPPRLIHQMIALEDTDMFEFSTQHFEEDSFRVAPGDSQKTNQ